MKHCIGYAGTTKTRFLNSGVIQQDPVLPGDPESLMTVP